tara:strand:- start:133 stop:348 length:216 start_codon:yes stop_codon:yes gene_type:complete
MAINKTAYLEALDKAEEVIHGMYTTVEREVEWCLTDEMSTRDAKSITSKIDTGITEALNAIAEQRLMLEAL